MPKSYVYSVAKTTLRVSLLTSQRRTWKISGLTGSGDLPTASGLSKARKSMEHEWRVPAHLMGWMKAGTRKHKSYLADLFLRRVRS